MIARRGFTLVELMIVVCIIGILASVVMPKQRELSRHAQATALLERVRLIRTALAGVDLALSDSLSAPAGTVPAPLVGSLNADDLAGEGGVTLEIAAHASEQWVLIHGDSPAQHTLLQTTAALAQREGWVAHWEGAVLSIALNDAAARARPVAPTVADPGTQTQSPPVTPAVTPTQANAGMPSVSDYCSQPNAPSSCAARVLIDAAGPPPGWRLGDPADARIPAGTGYSDTFSAWGIYSCSQLGAHPELTWDGMDGATAQMICEAEGTISP